MSEAKTVTQLQTEIKSLDTRINKLSSDKAVISSQRDSLLESIKNQKQILLAKFPDLDLKTVTLESVEGMLGDCETQLAEAEATVLEAKTILSSSGEDSMLTI